MSLSVDIKAEQSYLTSRLKEVQVGDENHAQANFAKPPRGTRWDPVYRCGNSV
jgi:hypothetical protein